MLNDLRKILATCLVVLAIYVDKETVRQMVEEVTELLDIPKRAQQINERQKRINEKIDRAIRIIKRRHSKKILN